jgi:catalase
MRSNGGSTRSFPRSNNATLATRRRPVCCTISCSGRSEKFFDHFSQATMFVNSQSPAEKDHMVEALRFELGKVERLAIRQRMVAMLNEIDADLAARVADGLGFTAIPPLHPPVNHSIPADMDPEAVQPRTVGNQTKASPALSMANTVKDTIATRKVAVLPADGVDWLP